MTKTLLLPLLVALPIVSSALVALLRPVVDGAAGRALDRAYLGSLASTAIAAIVAFVAAVPGAPTTLRMAEVDLPGLASAFGLVFHLDRPSLIVAATVSVVGFAVYRYSLRYLDGEAKKARFLGVLGFTVAAVETLVFAGNLLLFALAWVLVSTGLHFLLVHYAERPAAVRAARRKFLVSRLGDVGLGAAIVVLAGQFGTLDLAALNAAASLPLEPEQRDALSLAGFGFALAALCKSAQVPLHGWLPDTLEAPTPVSALMHAGVVNAGGYLLIRTSPLLAEADGALASLAFFGAITACFATLVTSTQTEVKRALAWSTVAQMGFMILQCGLAAPVAALVHLVGHSLYKAHAFLASGTLPAAVAPARASAPLRTTLTRLALGTGLAFATLLGGFAALGHAPDALPGGITLAALAALGLGALAVPARASTRASVRGLAIVALALVAVGITHGAHALVGADVATLHALEARGAVGASLAALVVALAAATVATGVALADATAEGRGLRLYLALRRGSIAPLRGDLRLAEGTYGRNRTAESHGREA